jgi:hypothetical protein
MQRLRNHQKISHQLSPEEFFNDYDRIVTYFDRVEDDVIRAVAPSSFPGLRRFWLSITDRDESIWAEEEVLTMRP